MLAVVPRDDQVQVEADLVEHLPGVRDAPHRLLAGEHMDLAHFVASHAVAQQFLGEREVPRVPHHQVVLLDDLTRGWGHANSSLNRYSAIYNSRRNRSVSASTERDSRWPT